MYLLTYCEIAIRNVKVNLLFVCLNVKKTHYWYFVLVACCQKINNWSAIMTNTSTKQENKTTCSKLYKHISKVALISFLFNCFLNCIFDLMYRYKITRISNEAIVSLIWKCIYLLFIFYEKECELHFNRK